MPSCFTINRARPLLGTFVSIGCNHADEAQITDAFAAIETIQGLMSFHDLASELSQLNRGAHRTPISVSAATWAVLSFAQELSLASEGLFDITVGGHLAAQGLLPAHGDITPSRGSYRDITLLPGRKVFFRQALALDLGGIAKGYAVDCAAAVLDLAGVSNYLINAGGDLRVGSSEQLIHIRHPAMPQGLGPVIEISNAGVATSAGYFTDTFTENAPASALVDPRQWHCLQLQGSITVLAPTAMVADALTKVVALQGAEAATLLSHYGAHAILQDEHGRITELP